MSGATSAEQAIAATQGDEPNPVVEKALAERPDEIVERYTRQNHLDRPATIEMVRAHYYIERRLARSIRESTKEDRAQAAEDAYRRYYQECWWLAAWQKPATADPREFSHFLKLLRPFGKRIYEVGSGSGALAQFLCGNGYDCVATDIGSAPRGDAPAGGPIWHNTDGIHLTRYESPASYDAVISSQVIEHLHPDDIAEHCAEALRLLKPGGAYLMVTPNRLSGPADMAELFGMEVSDCFHLREYTHGELAAILRRAGFARVRAVYVAPKKLRSIHELCFVSGFYLRALTAFEKTVEKLPRAPRKGVLEVLHKVALWRRDVCLLAERAR